MRGGDKGITETIKNLSPDTSSKFAASGAVRLVSVAVASGWFAALFVLLAFGWRLQPSESSDSKVRDELNHWARASKNLGHTFRGNEQSDTIAQRSLISLSTLAEHLREKSGSRLTTLRDELPPKGPLRDTIQIAISEIEDAARKINTDLKPLIKNQNKRTTAKTKVGELGRLLESLSVRLTELKGKT